MNTSVYMIRAIIEAVARLGHDANPLLLELGLGAGDLANGDLRVPYKETLDLWERAVSLTGDPDLGLHAAEQTRLGSFDVLDYALYSSPSLGSALRRLVRYFRLITAAARLELRAEEDRLWVQYRTTSPPRPWPRQAAEFTIACIVVQGRRTTGVDWAPLAVHFSHPRPADVAEHERIFRAPIEFGQPLTGIAIERALLQTPMVEADLRLLAILERHADALLAKLPGDAPSTGDRVRQHLVNNLRGNLPSVEETAVALGLGRRTLQRRLTEEGASYQELMDEVRQHLAHRYLEETRVPISEVAFLLGFSEPSAFHRAFRRWSGTTPAEYRRHWTAPATGALATPPINGGPASRPQSARRSRGRRRP